MARKFGVLMAVAAILAGMPAAAQLQAPRPELTTEPPSPPANATPMPLVRSRQSPSPAATGAPPSVPAPASPSQAAASPPPPSFIAPAAAPLTPRPVAPLRRRSAGDDVANRLNHDEMERLRQTRRDIVPPTLPPPNAPPVVGRPRSGSSSIVDELNQRQFAHSRADRRTDDER